MTGASSTWGKIILDGLAAGGVETVCISPGSRSTPLVMAASAHPEITTYSILDERSNGFFALGRAKKTASPVATVSTSGTAAANFHPAVIEADRSGTPLIVCTADRPPELQHSGSNQTVRQSDLYENAVRWAPTIPSPRDDSRTSQSLSATIATGVARSERPNPGPVHFNIPLRKPLVPDTAQEPFESIENRSAKPTYYSGQTSPSSASLSLLSQQINATSFGWIIAGPTRPIVEGNDIIRLAKLLGYPILADPLSGVRFGTWADVVRIGGYDGYISTANGHTIPDPELVLHIGGTPTSVRLQNYLKQVNPTVIRVDPVIEYQDPTFRTDTFVESSISRLVSALDSEFNGHHNQRAVWDDLLSIETEYWESIDAHPNVVPPEGRIAAETLSHAPSGSTVFVSNSMPIRDVDRYCRPQDGKIAVFGNRGASGIDGIISTGFGTGSVDTDELIFLIGDLAYLHDINGLQLIDRAGIDATIVVINNDGGGIFEQLPIASFDPPFTEQFRTPHGFDLGKAAATYDVAHRSVTSHTFVDVYEEELAHEGSTIIEVRIDRNKNKQCRDEFDTRIEDVLDLPG